MWLCIWRGRNGDQASSASAAPLLLAMASAAAASCCSRREVAAVHARRFPWRIHVWSRDCGFPGILSSVSLILRCTWYCSAKGCVVSTPRSCVQFPNAHNFLLKMFRGMSLSLQISFFFVSLIFSCYWLLCSYLQIQFRAWIEFAWFGFGFFSMRVQLQRMGGHQASGTPTLTHVLYSLSPSQLGLAWFLIAS